MKPIAILAALGSLQAIAAQVIPGKMIWVDKTTCDPWAKSQGFPSAAGSGGLFTTAYDILDKMVIASSYRVYHPTTQSPTTLPANVLAWERYRLNSTYTAFWGNNTATTSNLGGPLGVWNIASKLYSWLGLWQMPLTRVHKTPFIQPMLYGDLALKPHFSWWSAMMPRIYPRTVAAANIFTVSV